MGLDLYVSDIKAEAKNLNTATIKKFKCVGNIKICTLFLNCNILIRVSALSRAMGNWHLQLRLRSLILDKCSPYTLIGEWIGERVLR